MEYLLDKWPALAIILIYLIFFLPTIVINIYLNLSIFFIIFVLLLGTIFPKTFVKFIGFLDLKFDSNDIHKLGFKLGKFTRKIQKDLTDLVPNFIPRRLILFPIQKKITDLYTEQYLAIAEGVSKGLTSGIRQKGVEQEEEIPINKLQMFFFFAKIPIFLLPIFLLMVLISGPIIILMILILNLF